MRPVSVDSVGHVKGPEASPTVSHELRVTGDGHPEARSFRTRAAVQAAGGNGTPGRCLSSQGCRWSLELSPRLRSSPFVFTLPPDFPLLLHILHTQGRESCGTSFQLGQPGLQRN